MANSPHIVGVDGCPAGWFAVRLYGQDEYEVCVFATFKELVEHYKAVDLILVDIPIGLPEGPQPRECDEEAEKRLGWPRSASVFCTPTRQTVKQAARDPKNHAAASRVQRDITCKGLSRQSFNIAPKIAEVDSLLPVRGNTGRPRIREVHPELCFWALNKRQAMKWRKKERDKKGFRERLNVLRCFHSRADEIVARASEKYLRKEVAWDDVADALAAAITGYRGCDSLKTLPDKPPTDAKGLPMEMVYWEP